MSDIKDFVDANDFQKWAKANAFIHDFEGRHDSKGEWRYDHGELDLLWRCWRAARNGFMPENRKSA